MRLAKIIVRSLAAGAAILLLAGCNGSGKQAGTAAPAKNLDEADLSVLTAQKSPLDHFMYYDASYSVKWNGLFDSWTQKPLKSYYPLKAFGELYDLGTEVFAESDTHAIYAAGAVSEDGGEAAILLSYYKDHPSIDGTGTEEETVRLKIDWKGFSSDSGVDAAYLLLDAGHDMDAVSEETFFGSSGAHEFELPLYTTVLVRLKKR